MYINMFIYISISLLFVEYERFSQLFVYFSFLPLFSFMKKKEKMKSWVIFFLFSVLLFKITSEWSTNNPVIYIISSTTPIYAHIDMPLVSELGAPNFTRSTTEVTELCLLSFILLCFFRRDFFFFCCLFDSFVVFFFHINWKKNKIVKQIWEQKRKESE